MTFSGFTITQQSLPLFISSYDSGGDKFTPLYLPDYVFQYGISIPNIKIKGSDMVAFNTSYF